MNLEPEYLKVIEDARAKKSSIYFSGDGLDITFQSRIIDSTGDSLVLENTVPPVYVKRFIHSNSFSLQCQMLRFSSRGITTNGVNFVLPMASATLVEETRQSQRFSFDLEEKVFCDLLNPFDNETRLFKPVLNMSASGVSIKTTHESKLMRPGTTFSDIKILIGGEPYTRAAGTIVYSRKLLDRKGHMKHQVGIKFTGS